MTETAAQTESTKVKSKPKIKSKPKLKHLPEGVVQINGTIKISVALKPEIFNRVKARAKQRNEFFNETVNDCLGCGLLDLEEAGE